jgi:hypothetical protein
MTRINRSGGAHNTHHPDSVQQHHTGTAHTQSQHPKPAAKPAAPPTKKNTNAASPSDLLASKNVIANRHQANLRAWQSSQGKDSGTPRATATNNVAARQATASGKIAHAENQARFNQPLRTDRAPGDPDRNREVNRQRVHTHEGHVVYPARVRADAHFFDKQHKNPRPVGASRLDIDLTVKKRTMADENGVKHTYVYARRKNSDGTTTGGYVRRSSFPDFKREVKADPFRFPLAPGGDHTLYDGSGNKRGRVIDSRGVGLNFGQQKEIKGQRYYYVFDVMVDHDNNPKTERIHLSGWMHESAIPADVRPVWRMGADARVAPAAPTRGAPPQTRTVRSVPNQVKQQYAGLSVTPQGRGGVGRKSPQDYLGQRDGAINMAFNLPGAGGQGGGLSTDTLKPGTRFYRTPSVEPVRIPLYEQGTNRRAEKTMTFVYGYVQDPLTGHKRYGWIANDALNQL